MKKKHYSMLLFFAAAVFVAVGLLSRPLLSGLKLAAVQLVHTGDVEAFIDDVDATSKNLSYKGELIDLYSLWYRLTDTREVVKEDATVLRLNNDFLAFQPKVADGETLREMADACARLKAVTDGAGSSLLYVMAPNKVSLSQNGSNPVADNLRDFAELLDHQGVPVLNLKEQMEAQGIAMEEAFFPPTTIGCPRPACGPQGRLLRLWRWRARLCSRKTTAFRPTLTCFWARKAKRWAGSSPLWGWTTSALSPRILKPG